MLVKRRPTDVACRCGVYIIPCKECDFMFIGQTRNRLEVRLNHHKDAVRLAHANNAVFKHVRDTTNTIIWRAAKLVLNFNVV